jgi:hypothetical protein
MFVVASREERVRVISRRRGSSRCVRGGALSVYPIVQTHYGMIAGAIEFKERSPYPIGKFNELIQDKLDVRGTSFLIGKGATKVLNCLRTCRLIPDGQGCTKGARRVQKYESKTHMRGGRYETSSHLPKVRAVGSRALRQDRQT